jgi:hypothetical protein
MFCRPVNNFDHELCHHRFHLKAAQLYRTPLSEFFKSFCIARAKSAKDQDSREQQKIRRSVHGVTISFVHYADEGGRDRSASSEQVIFSSCRLLIRFTENLADREPAAQRA